MQDSLQNAPRLTPEVIYVIMIAEDCKVYSESYLTLTKAAQRKGVHRWQLYYAVRTGKLAHDHTASKTFYFRPETVDAWQPQSRRNGRPRHGRYLCFPPDRVLLVDVARALGLHVWQVRRRVQRGLLPTPHKDKGVCYYHSWELVDVRP